jgi:hypothetical protein
MMNFRRYGACMQVGDSLMMSIIALQLFYFLLNFEDPAIE